MIYAHIVAAIEGYLSASFIHTVLNSKTLFNRLCLTDPQLKGLKFDIGDLLNKEKILLVQGTGFNWPENDHFRIVFLQSPVVLNECMDRLEHFLETYRQK